MSLGTDTVVKAFPMYSMGELSLQEVERSLHSVSSGFLILCDSMLIITG